MSDSIEKKEAVELKALRLATKSGNKFFNFAWESMKLLDQVYDKKSLRERHEQPESCGFYHPIIFLLGQAIESWLKAILLANNNCDIKHHDLIKLLDTVERIPDAPSLNKAQKSAVSVVNKRHKKRNVIYEPEVHIVISRELLYSLYCPFVGFGEQVELYVRRKQQSREA